MEENAQNIVDDNKFIECIQCGVCSGSCPVSMKSNLNIRKIMRDMVFSGRIEIPSRDVLWSCTTCSTCEARCPKNLIPFNVLIEMRSFIIEEGRVEPTIRDALESVFKNGNPWDRARSKRSEWAEGIDVNLFSKNADFLYFVGCTPAYDPRCQEVSKSLVKTFEACGAKFGILGNDENCCGSSVYGMGEKGLFELLVEDNLELFESVDVERMVTTSPHCYNTFKNRYDKIDFIVQHYTEFISDLIDEKKLRLMGKLDKTVTYHDPCFLGRKNNVYDEPRKIIESIPNVRFVEFDRSRERSVCCEGGGGRMWIDVTGDRLAENRVKDAVEMGADILVTACPFCLSTLEDAVLTSGNEGSIEVMDVVELIAKVL